MKLCNDNINKNEVHEELENVKHCALAADDKMKTASTETVMEPNLQTLTCRRKSIFGHSFRIFLTIPVNIASYKESFNKSKVIKNYL